MLRHPNRNVGALNRASGRPLLALRFEARQDALVGTALARPELLRPLRLADLATHRRGAHQSQFRLDPFAWDAIPAALERGRTELVISRASSGPEEGAHG